MPNTAEKLMSLDEFLAWEREQPERYEYAGGVATMMTGALARPRRRSRSNIALRFAAGAYGAVDAGRSRSDAKIIAQQARSDIRTLR